MADTKIEWADKVWNPVRGCSRISIGCGGPNGAGGCYAEKIAARFSDPGQTFHGFATRTKYGGQWTGKMALVEDKLTEPLHWRKPSRIFVNSMSDLFHENLSDDAIDKVFAVMALCPQHTFMILTKRADRMRKHCEDKAGAWAGRVFPHWAKIAVENWGIAFKEPQQLHFPLPNVWMGVSVEDQDAANLRIPDLLATKAAVRFLSCEPLLGPVDLTRIATMRFPQCELVDAVQGKGMDFLGESVRRLNKIDQVICGGESGPRKRPTDIAWHRSLRDQCKDAGVAFFEKQIDKKQPIPEDLMVRQWP